MHTRWLGLVLAACIGGLAGPSSAQTAAASDWRLQTVAAGGFSVMVPAALSADQPSTDNGTVVHLFTTLSDRQAYVISYADGQNMDSPTSLSNARDGLLKSLSVSLVSEHRFQSSQPVGAVTALEFNATDAQSHVVCKARVFGTVHRMWVVGAATREGQGSAVDMDKFLDSFKITRTD